MISLHLFHPKNFSGVFILGVENFHDMRPQWTNFKQSLETQLKPKGWWIFNEFISSMQCEGQVSSVHVQFMQSYNVFCRMNFLLLSWKPALSTEWYWNYCVKLVKQWLKCTKCWKLCTVMCVCFMQLFTVVWQVSRWLWKHSTSVENRMSSHPSNIWKNWCLCCIGSRMDSWPSEC